MNKDLKIHKIWFQNFMSYGQRMTEVQLDTPGMTLIKGVNLDDTVNGIGANGVGKSTIIIALVYAFYGEAIGDSKVDELINDVNKKKCVVGVEFSIGKDRYHIVRYRKMKAGAEGTYIHIFKNDDCDKDDKDKTRKNLAKATLPETTKYIINDIISMPKELFVRLVVFDADEQSFFKLGASLQREVLENLFHLTILSEKADGIKERQKETKKEADLLDNTIQHLEEKVEDHESQIKRAKRRIKTWEEDRQQDLEEYKNDLEALNGIDVEYEKSLFDKIDEADREMVDLREKVADLKLQVKDCETNIRSLKRDRDAYDDEIHDGVSETKQLRKKIDQLMEQIATLNDNKCPECMQSMPDVSSKVSEREGKIKDHECRIGEIERDRGLSESKVKDYTTKIMEQNELLTSLQNSMDLINDQMAGIESKLERPSVKSREKLSQISSQRDRIKGKIEDLEGAENPHTDAFEELEAKEIEDIDYDRINHLKKLLDHQKFMLKLLTDKKSYLRQRLINKRLPFLNDRLTTYLKQLGLPYQVQFQSDLTAKITRRGRTKSFGNLSHGQRARVNFALSFAFRDMMEHLNRRVNVCMLDEVLDKALCDVGANAAITMIRDKCKADKMGVFVITHKKEIANRFNKTMTVTLKNGFSAIEVNS